MGNNNKRIKIWEEEYERKFTITKNAKMSGITLIALVVTIVVLLILAGITISLVFSENGIIAKAREAANKTNEAIINEQTQMNDVTAAMENMLNGTGGSTTPEEPEGCPAEEFEKWNGTSDEKVNAVQSTDAEPITVPVPKGYTASKVTGETTVEDGFVIYEGEEEVNDTNKDTAQTTRNQFVWVPVANPSEMYGRDEDCKKWGKLYEFSSTGITPLNWTESGGVMSITSTTNYREPDVVTGSDGTEYDADNTNLQQAGLDASATADTFKAQLETEFNSMIASVEKYGGFYIGRYETGNLSQAEAVVVKNNSDINNQTWYTQYKKAKGVAANSNVTTSMIWGCQWDAVMRWMYNSGDEEKKTYTYDSTGKGNYNGTNGNEAIPTGTNDAYSVNNIYDMAGNVRDWTIEALSTYIRVYRGGNVDLNASDYPASGRFYDVPTSSYSHNGSRLALYM